jgi:nitrate reductase gamma subunit
MDAFVEVGVFLVLPYAAFVAFVVGVVWRVHGWLAARGRTGLRSVAVMPNTYGASEVTQDLAKRVVVFYSLPKMEDDRTLIVGTMMFHYGIWVVLISHLGLIVPLPISASTHYLLGLYIGGAAGLLTLAGLLVLTVRRIRSPSLRRISFFDDYFAVGLLFLIIVFGLVQTLVIQPNYLDTVSPWLTSILTFSPNLSPIASVGIFTVLHIAFALLFIAYLPYGKMAHIVAYMFTPTLTGPSFRVDAQNVPSASAPLSPRGGDPR